MLAGKVVGVETEGGGGEGKEGKKGFCGMLGVVEKGYFGLE